MSWRGPSALGGARTVTRCVLEGEGSNNLGFT